MKTTLVYYDEGDICLQYVEKTRKQIRKEAKEAGQKCYLSGYRYWDNYIQSVMVFFKETPTRVEIERRRINGLKRATLHYL